jgi:hypothetical protein
VEVSDGTYPVKDLYLAAWEMWRDQKRRFGAGTYVSPDLLAPLLDPRVKIVRAKGGKVYEFRHDEMRGYLAAKWLAEQVVSPLSLFEEDVKIWQNGRDEQKVLWGFFADQVTRETGEQLWRWATVELERVVLQHALQRRGEQEGWKLDVPSSPDGDGNDIPE